MWVDGGGAMARHEFPFWRFEGLCHRLLRFSFRRRFGAYGAGAFVSPFATVDGLESIAIGAGAVVARRTRLLIVGQPSGEASYLTIGARSYVGRGCTLSACGTITIGADVTIGDNAYVSAGQHGFGEPGTHILHQAMQPGSVDIGDGAWIGYGAFVSSTGRLAIGEGAIIAANSVVAADVPARTMVGGVPARPIRRFDPDQREWVRIAPAGE